jgi:hypothetical protein
VGGDGLAVGLAAGEHGGVEALRHIRLQARVHGRERALARGAGVGEEVGEHGGVDGLEHGRLVVGRARLAHGEPVKARQLARERDEARVAEAQAS